MEKYKQTKESFEQFLAECRELAKDIKLPLPDKMGCPVCEGISFLRNDDELFHMIDQHRWKGTHWFYKCGKCLEEFTTNESDGISLASMQPVEQPNNNP